MDPMPGRCFLCGASLPQNAMQVHLMECRPNQGGPTPLFLLFVQDAYFPQTYWLFLEVAQQTPLSALDDFLRRLWVDCCGHYSQFVIDGETYGRRPKASIVDLVLDEYAHLLPMDRPLQALLQVGQQVNYAYDDAWFTELRIHVLAAYEGPHPEDDVRLLARNYKPPRTCRQCDREAAWLFTNTWPLEPYCSEHAKQHPAWGQPDAFLPYINSPRVGVCSYRGPQAPELLFEVYPPPKDE